MKPITQELTIEDLQESGVSKRNIYFYIENKVIDHPNRGRNARYNEKHLIRLKLIQKFKDAVVKEFGWNVPLGRIKDVLDRIQKLEKKNPGLIDRLLSSDPSPDAIQQVITDKSVLKNASFLLSISNRAEPAFEMRPPSSGKGPTWTRLELFDGLELHVRSDVAEKVMPTVAALQQLAAKRLG